MRDKFRFLSAALSILSFFLCIQLTSIPSVLSEAQAANTLNTGNSAPAPSDISINPPSELDYKTKDQVYTIRRLYVAQHQYLLAGDYFPSEAVFGQIIDGKPWWGVEGQFCGGSRRPSIEGVSEEARFILNPFLLLAIEETQSWNVEADCSAVYPEPISLQWFGREHKAIVTYAMSDFFNYRRQNGFPPMAVEDSTLYLKNLNARDFGYEFMRLDPAYSSNIKQVGNARMFEDSVKLQSFIHCGGSCGQSGGCNNGSPGEPDLHFLVDRLPATMNCKLWKNKPVSPQAEADFIFIIELQ
jgi:hypothetical protein